VIHRAIQPQKPAPEKVGGYDREAAVLLSERYALVYSLEKSLKETYSAKSFDIHDVQYFFFFGTSFQLSFIFPRDMEGGITDCTKLNIGMRGFPGGKYPPKHCNSLRYSKSR